MTPVRMFFISAGLLVLGACSSVPYAQRQAQRQADVTAAAGAPASSFRFFTLYSWEPLSTTELVVYTEPNRAWLLDVGGGCDNLPFTQAIGLTSNLHQVSVGFDKVLTGGRYIPCMITQIRPLDLKQLKATQQARRTIESESRAAEGEPKG